MCLDSFKNYKSVGVSFSIVVLIFAAFWLATDSLNKIKEGKFIGQDIAAKNTISVTGSGEVFAKPDLAQTNFSVIGTAKTVELALSDNAKKMNAVIDFIKGQKIEPKDLKTTSFNISPQYEYQRIQPELYPFPPGKRILIGYEVNQSLQVKIRDFAKIGLIIQGAADSGANQIGDLQFAIEKEDDLKKQARKEAIDKAKAKVRELTDQLGVKLVRLVSFNENQIIPFFGFEKAAFLSPTPSGGGVPQIETGENKIEVTVNITYEIK